jgi:catechol 2,3-dioxygenase-like lactoylglutathione lyase family enzyme
MEFHRGRLIDHVHLRVKDLERSRRFYEAVLSVFDIPLTKGEHYFFADELWVDVGDQPSRVHLAFQAPDRETVGRFHAAGLSAGGRDNGAPGERKYHPGYYAAYLFDPDGNNVEAVHHGPFTRSAKSVIVKSL